MSRTSLSARSRRAAIPALIALVAGALVGVASPAFAAGTATISGTVSGANSAALLNVKAQVSRWDPATHNFDGVFHPQVAVDGSGHYEVTGLDAGQYAVCFYDQASPAVYAYKCVGETRDIYAADFVTVADGGAATANITLELGATISGTITTPPDNDPLTTGGVLIYDVNDPDQNSFQGDDLDGSGNFSVSGLPAGTYAVYVEPEPHTPPYHSIYVREFIENKATLATAEHYTLAAGGSVSVGEQISLGATIRGTVTKPGGGDTSGITVTAYYDTEYGKQQQYSTTTAADGTYVLDGLPANTYKIRFDGMAQGLAQQYYNGSPSGSSDYSTAVSLPLELASNTASVNAQLVAGSTFSGTLTYQGAPTDGYIEPQRQEAGGTWDALTDVQADETTGAYSVTGLAPGTYRFLFMAGSNPAQKGAAEYWNNKYFADEATPVTITSVDQLGKDLDLAPSGTLRVHFSESGGEDVTPGTALTLEYEKSPGVWKEFHQLYGGSGDNQVANFSYIPTGTYRLSWVDNPGYQDQWYDSASTVDLATPILLGPGATVDTESILDLLPVSPAPTPTITGTPKVGVALTAVPGTWGPAGVTLSYSWSVDGEVRADSDSPTFTPVVGDENKTITVAVRGTREGSLTVEKVSAPTAAVALGTLSPAPVPTISGTPQVGVELTATAGTWGPAPVALSYQWFVGATAQASTTNKFTPQPGDDGKTVTVKVTGSKTGYAGLTKTSAATAAIAPATLTASPVPTISGTPQVGVELTANAGSWGPAPVALTYQWFVGATAQASTTNKFTPQAGDDGKTVTVKVTGTKAGYAPVTRTSAATAAIVKAPVSPASIPTITGTAQVGKTLALNEGAWAEGATLNFQWYVGGVLRSGANGFNFAPTTADVGKTVTVKVTGSLSGYTTVSKTSAPTAAVVAATPADVDQLYGSTRYDTAVAISQNFEPGVQRVYIATGTGYADALGAAAAAAHFNSPLLLSDPASLPASIRTELIRLHPAEIVVVGGPTVVSANVENQLAALAFDPAVRRIFGADRYETSRLIAADAFQDENLSTAYVADGSNFPDALASGPAAAHFGGPVLLVKGAGASIGSSTINLLNTLDVETVKVAGGTGAVSPGIATQFANSGFTVKRLAGADRYATAVAINADAFTSSDQVYLATGLNYADALTGAALAAFNDAPLFVARTNCVPGPVLTAIANLGADQVFLLGGPGALGAGVAQQHSC